LLTYVAELLGEDEDWLPTITRPPGDRVIEVIGLFCLTRRSHAGAAARRVLRAKKTPEPFWNPLPYTTH
jgi:hypothetical protein